MVEKLGKKLQHGTKDARPPCTESSCKAVRAAAGGRGRHGEAALGGWRRRLCHEEDGDGTATCSAALGGREPHDAAQAGSLARGARGMVTWSLWLGAAFPLTSRSSAGDKGAGH